MDGTAKLEISNFPDELRRRFKAAAARKGKFMSEVLVELAESWTEAEEQQRESAR